MNIDLRSDLNSIFKEGYNFKRELLSSAVSGKPYPKSKLLTYLRTIDGFLKTYDMSAFRLKDEIQNIEPVEGINTIPYRCVKKYIYLSYDYSSILQFVDGLINGINDYHFTTDYKVEEFKKFVLSKAFKNIPIDNANLLDDIVAIKDNTIISTIDECNLFNVLKDLDIFDKNNKYEIYHAIEKSLNYIIDKINNKIKLLNDTNMFPIFINSIVEFIHYILNVYAARVYVFNIYINSFKNKEMTESTYSDIMQDNVNTMLITDEIYSRDISKFDDFKGRIIKFLDKIGVSLPEKAWEFDSNNPPSDLCGKLYSNKLFKLIADERNFMDNNSDYIILFNTELRPLYYSSKHAIEYTNTPKDELLYLIKDIGSESSYSLPAIKNIIRDYSIFGLKLLSSIKRRTDEFLRFERNNTLDPDLTLSADIKNSETFKILAEFYRDMAGAILYKGRDLEVKYNKINNKRLIELSSDLMIDDYNPNHQMNVQVSQTLRNKDDFRDEFIRQEFELLQLESVILMEEFDMVDDPYFININEAFSLSDLMNKVLAALAAFRKKVSEFFNNDRFKKATEWVASHRQELSNMKFNGTLKVYPYLKDIDISHITDFINTINSFNENMLSDEKKFDEFIKKLYNVNGKQIYDIFNSDSTNAIKIYTSHVLFGSDITTQYKEVDAIEISNDEIKKYLNNWVDNVVGSELTHKTLISQSDKMKDAMNGLKSKIVSIQNKQLTDKSQEAQSPIQDNDKQNTQPKQEPEKQNNVTSLNNLLMQVNTASLHIFDSLYHPITRSILDQYKYIQEAYSIRVQ